MPRLLPILRHIFCDAEFCRKAANGDSLFRSDEHHPIGNKEAILFC